MIDDFHWSDAQSVELLDIFAEDITSLPVIIVIALRKSIISSQASPLILFMDSRVEKSENVFGIKLAELTKENIADLSHKYINNYKSNKKFESWIYDNSLGVPGAVTEYLRYFNENSPFKSDGKLIDNFEKSDFLPSTIHSTFSKTIEKLTDEQKNILSICSSEGRECTALIISSLLNTDILTTIKKLRSIQQKTGVIRSIGAHKRYGVKTTIYEFTQAFYKKYFESLLEYEEYVSLHGQIASLLRQKYEEAESEALKHEIAPYLAAHSSESGDEETAKSMLLVSAKAAQKFGNTELLKEIYNRFTDIGSIDEKDETNPDMLAFKEIMKGLKTSESTLEVPEYNSEETGELNGNNSRTHYEDFTSARKIIVEYYHNNRFDEAVEYALDFINKNDEELRSSEKSQLLAIAIKSYIESGQIDLAENYADQALHLIETHHDPIAECFVMNALAVLRHKQNRKDEMFVFLKKAAHRAMSLSPELRLLTLANIALLTEKDEPLKSRRYYDSVRKLASELNFEQFSEDVLA